MKNIYKFLIIVFVVAVVVPQITLAAWWNPVSWGLWGKIWGMFNKQQNSPVEHVITIVSPSSGPIGTKVYLKGNGLRDNKGDQNILIENASGEVASFGFGDLNMGFILSDKVCKDFVTDAGFPCKSWMNITPGEYKIFVKAPGAGIEPFTTNKVKFVVTADPTAGWETYTNNEKGFSIKYPKNLVITENNEPSAAWILTNFYFKDPIANKNLRLMLVKPEVVTGNYVHMGMNELDGTLLRGEGAIETVSSEKVAGVDAKRISAHNDSRTFDGAQVYFINGNYGYIFMANENLNSKTDVVPILNQILSTFKFTESAIACTKDAKMCPDGSYVGRTGPNCEFLCPGDAKIDSCIKGGEIYQSPAVLGKKRGECCSGLGVIAQAATDDCELFSQMGGGNSICSNCGNNVCESWENKCTCPEDCKK